jgi:hypothetical protein
VALQRESCKALEPFSLSFLFAFSMQKRRFFQLPLYAKTKNLQKSNSSSLSLKAFFKRYITVYAITLKKDRDIFIFITR